MSFKHTYPNRKDWRRPYYDARRIDPSCRNHGSCSWCANRRRFFDRRARAQADEELRRWRRGE